MKACAALLVALVLAAGGCSRQDGATTELVRELRAMRGTLERMQGATRESARAPGPVDLDAAALQQALEPLRKLVQTLLTEQEALRARQDALRGEMSRWAQIVAPVLQGGPAADLQALQDRLEKLEEELRAQETRHREVQDLLLRAMNTTSERLEAFLQTLGEIRPAGTGPGTEDGRDSPSGTDAEPTEPPAERRSDQGPPDEGPPDEAPRDEPLPDEGSGSLTSRSGAEAWTPWVLLAGGALALLFLWRLWREPDVPPRVQPAADEADVQDWWVVVEELAQAMGAQPGVERRESAAVDFPGEGPRERSRQARPESVPDEVAQQLELPDPEAVREPRALPERQPAPEPERVTERGVPHAEAVPAPAGPADPEAPAVLELDEACADSERAAERLRSWLAQEPRVLTRPVPRIEAGDGRLRLRAWVTWDLPIGERRHLWTAARQVLHAGGGARSQE